MSEGMKVRERRDKWGRAEQDTSRLVFGFISFEKNTEAKTNTDLLQPCVLQ